MIVNPDPTAGVVAKERQARTRIPGGSVHVVPGSPSRPMRAAAYLNCPTVDTWNENVYSRRIISLIPTSIRSTNVAVNSSTPVPEIEEMSLNQLSERLQISKQTLVRWVDRHLINADLGWALSDENEEIRVIELSEETFNFLNSFSEDYREDTVTRTEARHILKKIDRKKVKKMIRAGDLLAVEVDDEVKIVVGSIEDYLIAQENGEVDEE